jgi:hypothetical protein
MMLFYQIIEYIITSYGFPTNIVDSRNQNHIYILMMRNHCGSLEHLVEEFWSYILCDCCFEISRDLYTFLINLSGGPYYIH